MIIVYGRGSTNHLTIATQPSSSGASGVALSVQPVIEIRNVLGNLAPSTIAVSVAIATGVGVLSGTTIVNAVAGVATFTNLVITGFDLYTLTFSAVGLTPLSSTRFYLSDAYFLMQNEPGGFTLYTDRNFASVAGSGTPIASTGDLGWTDTLNTAAAGKVNLNTDTDLTAPNWSTIASVLYRAGYVGGGEPATQARIWPSIRTTGNTIYVAFWAKYSDNWYGNNPAGVNKIVFILNEGSPGAGPGMGLPTTEWANGRLVVSGRGSMGNSLRPELDGQSFAANYNSGDGQGATKGPTFPGTATNGGSGATPLITRGQWFLVELLMKMNTANTADGEVSWWFSDPYYPHTYMGHWTGMQFVTSSVGLPDWAAIKWAGTYGGLSGNVPGTLALPTYFPQSQDQYEYMNRFYTSLGNT